MVKQSLRMFWRDGKRKESLFLALALFIAVTSMSALSHFAYIVNYQLALQASRLLGADVMISSPTAISSAWQKEAHKLHLRQTQTISALSMVEHQDKWHLAQIKAIAQPYPLLGTISLANHLFGEAIDVSQAPSIGEAWVSTRLFNPLDLKVGDSITIGIASFKVTHVLLDEPGQQGEWFSLSPKIMINQQDLPKTALIQKGSTISYQWLVSGPAVALNQLHTILKKELREDQWTDSQKAPAINKIIENTLTYLNLGLLMSLVLAGLSISMASLRYCQRQEKNVALLRCFGATKSFIFRLYLNQMFLLLSVAGSLGVALGYLLQPLFKRWLHGLLVNFDAPFSLQPAALSWGLGACMLFGFTLANLWQLRLTSPVVILRNQRISWTNSRLASHAALMLFLGSLAYYYTKSLNTTLLMLAACAYFIILAWSILRGSLFLIRRLKPLIPVKWRLAFSNIERNLPNSTLQVIGIGLCITAMLSLTLLEHHLTDDWQKELPAKTPNFFLINIEPQQLTPLSTFFQDHQLINARFYPMVRGRLTHINGRTVYQRLGEKVKTINALQRELNLSWTEELPPGNTIVSGQWQDERQTVSLSIEKELANTLGLTLGDTLTFSVASQETTGIVHSIRSVNWTNFQPNFFILFKPGVLNKLPQTYITSIYLSEKEYPLLMNLLHQFPNITIIDIANTIKTIQEIFFSASKAIGFIAFFALLSGLLIAILTMLSFSDLKEEETFVLKILGIKRRALLSMRTSESFIIGFFSGFLAILTTILLCYVFQSIFWRIPFTIPWVFLSTIPFLSAILTLLIHHCVSFKHYQKRQLV